MDYKKKLSDDDVELIIRNRKPKTRNKLERCKTSLDILNLIIVTLILTLVLVIVCFQGLPVILKSNFTHKLSSKFKNLTITFKGDGLTKVDSVDSVLAKTSLHKDSQNSGVSSSGDLCSFPENNRFDCWPDQTGLSEDACHKRGCCFAEVAKGDNTPSCFFASNYSSYSVTSLSQSSTGIQATLQRKSSTFFSKDSMTVQLNVEYQTDNRLRIRLYDPEVARYEVPLAVPHGSNVKDAKYDVTVSKSPFSLKVTRKSTGEAMFDTSDTAPLIFSDQFLQLSTKLSSHYIYGLGEHRGRFLQNISTWRRLTFWNHDAAPKVDVNLYGTHPMYLNLEQNNQSGSASRNAHGVFLLNSNAGEVAFSPYGDTGAVTYRMIGGILDFFVMMGPDPVSVVQQFTDIVGRPHLPAFWSLGYNLCRYGYKRRDGNTIFEVIARNRAANIPYDTQWTDIDMMNHTLDWTYDHEGFANLSDVVKDLHANFQRYVIMADVAISSSQKPGTYPPFDDGEAANIWVKNYTGQNLIGKVFPGPTTWPDWYHPNVTSWWIKQAKSFHDKIPFDGIWIDMNDPSNFAKGSLWGCPNTTYDNPPYLPPLIGGHLETNTICASAKQVYNGSMTYHFNTHNMYSQSEANVSRQMLNSVLGKRAPLISRGTGPGSGQFAGHWTGDVWSGWPQLADSISELLNFNLFGITQIGADICGFNGQANPELCTRWHQLGAFYSFMRNHNNMGKADQDPAAFPSPYVDHIRSALTIHYTLLPVLYSLFMEAHLHGTPVIRPLFYLYPGTEAIDAQFMWGDSILVSPVLINNVTKVTAFIPKDVWYDGNTYAPLAGPGKNMTLDAPLDTINFHIRGGSILPTLPPSTRTDLARKQPFTLLVAPNATRGAWGQLYWDDGENLDTSLYSHITFNATEGQLTSQVISSSYRPKDELMLGQIRVLGQDKQPTSVSVNGNSVKIASYDKQKKMFVTDKLGVSLLKPITMTWN